MPMMGPSYSEEKVDRLTNEIIQILIHKQAIEKKPEGTFIELREEDTRRLSQAIEQLVMHSAWEWF